MEDLFCAKYLNWVLIGVKYTTIAKICKSPIFHIEKSPHNGL